jgi:hypothetical protein
MFDCNKCLKNDVCSKKENLVNKMKDLELNKMVQMFKANGFNFSVECGSYLKGTKILGGKNGQ